ncbi:hypothetical protein MRX96_036944 [Rhipicephalus microplus]
MAGEDLKKAEERWGALENARSGGCYALPPSAPRRIGRWGREARVVKRQRKSVRFIRREQRKHCCRRSGGGGSSVGSGWRLLRPFLLSVVGWRGVNVGGAEPSGVPSRRGK